MQIEMHHVETHIPRTDYAHHGVEIGAVVIKKTARGMYDLRYGFDIFLEKTERGRIGKHQCRRILANRRAQSVEIHSLFLVGRNIHHVETRHCGACWIGAVRAVGNYYFFAGEIAPSFVIRADDTESRVFSVRPGRRLQSDRVHSGYLFERLAQFVYDFQRALRRFFGRQRVHIGKSFERSDLFVELGVVLHRAGAERIKAVVHAESHTRKRRIMPYERNFRKLGEFETLP